VTIENIELFYIYLFNQLNILSLKEQKVFALNEREISNRYPQKRDESVPRGRVAVCLWSGSI